MRNELQKKVSTYVRKRDRKRKRMWIVSVLSLAVAITTILCLTLPAITMSTICHQEAHSHGPECFTTVETPNRREILCEAETGIDVVIHTHDEYCYDTDGTLICSLPEITEHRHDDACYVETRNLTCGLEESDGHIHRESCYENAREAICGYTEEAGGHLHTELCFAEPRTPICGREEGTEHRHSEDCFENPRPLLCGYAAGDGAHCHGEDCYITERSLICEQAELVLHTHTEDCADGSCGLPQVIAHQHTEDCIYEIEGSEEQVLICQLPEHEHTPECYPDEGTLCGIKGHSHNSTCFDENGALLCDRPEHEHSEDCFGKQEQDGEYEPELLPGINENYIFDSYADMEAADYAEGALSGVSLTGNRPADLLAVARSQLGYRESTVDFVIDENGCRKGYTYYGDWYGNPYGDWCAMFVSFCLDTAGVRDYPLSAGCQSWIEKLAAEDVDLWRPVIDPVTGERYIPKPGDLVFYDFDLNGSADHVGIVSELIAETEARPALLKSIEGNYADMVCVVTHAQEYVGIMGYGELPENPMLPTEEESKPQLSLSAETESGVAVTVTGPENAFPADWENLSLVAREIMPEEADTETESEALYGHLLSWLEQTEEEYEVSEIRLFALSLLHNGQEEPLRGTVTVGFRGVEGSVPFAYHLWEDGTEALRPAQTGDRGGFVFDTEQLSWFGLVVTPEMPRRMVPVRQAAADTASLTVNKIWSDGGDHDPITVTLLKNGVPTGDSLTLSNDNGWTATFENLDPPDASGNFPYSVSEIELAGYHTRYSSIMLERFSAAADGYWIPATSSGFVDGKTYVIAMPNSQATAWYSVAYNANTSNLSTDGITRNGPITVNGTTYATHLTDVDESAQLYAIASGGGYKLYNAATGKYMKFSRSIIGGTAGTTTSSNDASVITFTATRRLSGDSRYLHHQTYSGKPSSDFNLAVAQSSGAQFELYEWLNAPKPNEYFYSTIISNIRISPHQGAGEEEHSPDINKRIDYLGDNGQNPDTLLTGDEFYRLYLDVHTLERDQPVDLLLVLDNSGSMFGNFDPFLIEGKMRNEILVDILREFIPQFLSDNSGNRISLVYFSGEPYDLNSIVVPVDYTGGNVANDAWLACDWTSNAQTATNSILTYDFLARWINGSYWDGGTNYMQGLNQAKTQIGTMNPDHKQVMLFFSDGVPTYYVQSSGLRGGNGVDYSFANPGTEQYTVGVRNVTNCWGPTETAVFDFRSQYPALNISSIGFSSGLSEGRSMLLEQMVQNDGFYAYASSSSSLRNAFEAVFGQARTSKVTITDELSQYVELYGTQPDYKVTMTNIDTGAVTVLYQNGTITEAGQNIVESVTYTPVSGSATTTGTVKLKFVPGYELNPDFRYTISYNVQVTQAAHDKFEADGYPHIGDEDTDYGSNDTSSEYPGLHSNRVAYVDYTVHDIDYTDYYVHPVVQVAAQTADLTITKTVLGDSSNEQFRFEILLRDAEGNPLSDIPTGTGYTVDTEAGKVSFTLAHGQSVTIAGLPVGTAATITEISHDGYTVLLKEGNQTLVAGDSGAVVLSADREITVVNSAGAVLPETGGTGALPYTSSGLAIMLGTLIYGYRWRKRERRSAE